MSILTLRDSQSGSFARIAVNRGFNCFEFKAAVGGRVVDVIDSEPGFETGAGRPSGNGVPVLFPFPNRIAGGRFKWAGKDYFIPAEVAPYDRTGNAIHGFSIDVPWRVVEQTESSATGEFQLSVDAPNRRSLWPADCIIRLKYTVVGAKLRTDIEVINPDTQPLPFGFGTHTYFKVPLATGSKPSDCLAFAPVRDCWDLTECLPSGRRLPIPEGLDLIGGQQFGARPLDNGFGVLPADEIVCELRDTAAGLRVRQATPGHYPELVIYTPPQRDSICFEPYTCMTDAINLEAQGTPAGWLVLEPGARFTSWIDIEASEAERLQC